MEHKNLTTPIKSVIKKTSRDIIKECTPSLYFDQVSMIKSETSTSESLDEESSIIQVDIDVDMKDEEEDDEELEEVENLDIEGRKKTPITKSPAPAKKTRRRYTFHGREVFKIIE